MESNLPRSSQLSEGYPMKTMLIEAVKGQVRRVPHEFVLMASKLLCTQVSQPSDDSWNDDDTCPKTRPLMGPVFCAAHFENTLIATVIGYI